MQAGRSPGGLSVKKPTVVYRQLWVSLCSPISAQERKIQAHTPRVGLEHMKPESISNIFKDFLFLRVKHVESGLENIVSWANLLNQLGLEGLSSTFRGA